ncbi:MAG: ABC transporter permease [Candidatus Sumerlaeota bacterium]|nr:ABC transporter permease [Candidatus Sumerlaeota bacterium]
MTLLPVIFDNPIFTRELRRRMRGKAMIFFLIAYVALVCGISYLILLVQTATLNPHSQNFLNEIANIGQAVFRSVLAVQGLLVLVVAPSITAGMITAERERQTFDFLKVTTIRPFTFVAGGLISTMMYVLLIQVCALPVLCVPFLYGGMSPEDVIGWFSALFGGSLALCSVGLFLSSIKEKTRSAQGAMMTITLALFFSYFFGVVSYTAIRGSGTNLMWSSVNLLGQYPVPGWVLMIAAGAAFAGIMVLVACRKLYDSDTRSLNYTQFLILFLVLFGFLAAKSWGAASPDDLEWWFLAGWALFFMAAMIFCTAEITAGDDLWRLNKRAPFLRRIDTAIAYMVFLSAFWAAVSWSFFYSGALASGAGVTPQALGVGLACVIVPSLCFAFIARIMVMKGVSGRIAFRLMLALALAIWVVLPVVCYIIKEAVDPNSQLFSMMASFSPCAAILQLLNSKTISSGVLNGDWWTLPGAEMIFTYAAISLGAFVLYLPLSWRYLRAQRRLWEING